MHANDFISVRNAKRSFPAVLDPFIPWTNREIYSAETKNLSPPLLTPTKGYFHCHHFPVHCLSENEEIERGKGNRVPWARNKKSLTSDLLSIFLSDKKKNLQQVRLVPIFHILPNASVMIINDNVSRKKYFAERRAERFETRLAFSEISKSLNSSNFASYTTR